MIGGQKHRSSGDTQGAGCVQEDDDFKPNNNDYFPLASVKITCRRKTVLESLRKLDVSKSTNGLGNRFLKECADVLEPTITKIFKLIVKRSSFVSNWKTQRVSPVHRRGPKSVPSKYRPVSVIDNLAAVFEDALKPQLEAWAKQIIPDWQFGFLQDCGTTDYGAALTLKIQDCLERRKEGALIATDMQGAVGRCWWARMKERLKKKGMKKKALNYKHCHAGPLAIYGST